MCSQPAASNALPPPSPTTCTRPLRRPCTVLPQDPDAAADEAAAAMTQQMGLLRDCLSDPCPKVREAAATGICRLLNNYWEIIPAATSALFIKKLTGTCVCV